MKAARRALAALAAVLTASSALPAGDANGIFYCGWLDGGPIDVGQVGSIAGLVARMDGLGTIHALWSQSNGTNWSVWTSRQTAGGVWSAPQRLSSQGAYYMAGADLAASPDGRAAAAWMESDSSIMATTFDPTAGWSNTTYLSRAATGAHSPSVVMDGQGTATAAWSERAGREVTVWTAQAPPGAAWSAPQLLERHNLTTSANPMAVLAAADEAGTVTLIYAKRVSSAGAELVAARLLPGGQWDAPTRLSQEGGAAIGVHLVAAGPDGRALATWAETTSTGDRMMASWFYPGAGWEEPKQLAATAGSFPRVSYVSLSASTSPDGGALVAWALYGLTGAEGIAAARFDPQSGWTFQEAIGSPGFGYSYDTAAAALSGGRGTVAWLAGRIYARSYSPDGGWGAAEDTGIGEMPSLASRESAGLALVWINGSIAVRRQDPTTGWAAEQRFTPSRTGELQGLDLAVNASNAQWGTAGIWTAFDGSKWTLWAYHGTSYFQQAQNSRRLDQGAGDARDPSITIDGRGRTWAVWSQPAGSAPRIWAARAESGYGPFSYPITIDTGGPGGAVAPQVAADRGGNATVVWAQVLENRSEVWGARAAVDGGWRAPLRLSSDVGNATRPQLSVEASGAFTATWGETNESHLAVFVRRLESGNWSDPVMLVSRALGGAMAPSVASRAPGHAVVWWVETAGDQAGLWASVRTPTGGWQPASRIDPSARSGSIDLDARGNAIAAWADGSPGAWRVLVSHLDAGEAWGRAVAIGESNGSLAPQVILRMDAGSDAVAVWSERNDSDGSVWTANYRFGSGWRGAARLPSYFAYPSAGPPSELQLAVDEWGGARLAWIWGENGGRAAFTASYFECGDYRPPPPVWPILLAGAAAVVAVPVAVSWLRRRGRMKRRGGFPPT